MRPSWPAIWMEFAHSIARRSHDPQLNVGAVIVSCDNSKVLSIGYNGNYRGGPHERESDVPGMSGFIHAETNALIKCDYSYHMKKHMYVTHSCCVQCAKLVVNSAIARVVYDKKYRDPRGVEIMKESGIEVLSIDEAIREYSNM